MENPSKHIAKAREPRVSWVSRSTIAAILVILYGLVLPAVTDMPTAASRRRVRAHSDAALLTMAVKAYHSEFGVAPTGTHSEIMRALLGSNPTNVVFYEPNAKRLNSSGELLDPWGVPYRIDTADAAKPRIYSFGPNKRDDGAAPQSDDIRAFQ